MPKGAQRREFVIKDLVVSLPTERGGAGGTFLPNPDDDRPLPWWISPIAAVLVKGGVLEQLSVDIAEAIERGEDLDSIGRALDGDPDGNPAVKRAVHDIGSAAVAAAAFSKVGSAGLPNPDDPRCGSSLETIPTPITPIVHTGIEVHRVSELPRIRKQLQVAVRELDRVAESLKPQGDEIKQVAKHLEQARAGLGK